MRFPQRRSLVWPVIALAAVGVALVSCETLVPVERAREEMAEDGFSGQVTRVVDGDTFWLDTSDVSIRVWGLDAPERGTPGGAEANVALTQLIAGERLACVERDIDRYGRVVGQCFLANGRDITAALIPSGARAGKGGAAPGATIAERTGVPDALASVVEAIRAEGHKTLRAMAAELNRRGTATRRGGPWQVSNLRDDWRD